MSDEEVPFDPAGMDQLLEEASLWFARMRGPDAEVFRPEFEKWLSLGAAHRGAYNRAGEIFALGRFLAQEEADQIAAKSSRMPQPLARPRWVITAGLVAAAAVGLWIGKPYWLKGEAPSSQADAPNLAGSIQENRSFSTVSAGRRRETLSDGSMVTLEAGSILRTNFSDRRRELRLERGTARFEVAHERRPFVVLAGGGSVTARGTIFDVIVTGSDRVTVRLLRGAVDVARPATPDDGDTAPRVTRLSVGEELSFSVGSAGRPTNAGKGIGLGTDPRPTDASDVREFDEQPLSAVIAETNRGSATQIRLDDASLGDLKVSGRFRIDDPDQVADRLAHLFELEANRSKPDQIILRRP